MRNLFLVLAVALTAFTIQAQKGVDMNSMNTDITTVVQTTHVDAKFTFGLLSGNMLKWQLDYYDLAYKEYLFTILSKEIMGERQVYLVKDISHNTEKEITFFFGDIPMVLIQEEGVAPLILTGDIKF